MNILSKIYQHQKVLIKNSSCGLNDGRAAPQFFLETSVKHFNNSALKYVRSDFRSKIGQSRLNALMRGQ